MNKKGLQHKKSTQLKKKATVAKNIAKKVSEPKDLVKKSVMNKIELLPADSMLTNALFDAGMTPQVVAEMIKELCLWKSVKMDKHGEVHESIDGNLRMKALELWAKVTGSSKKDSGSGKTPLPEGTLDALYKKAKR